MAYTTYQTVIADGVASKFDFTFPYIDGSDLQVYVNGVSKPFTLSAVGRIDLGYVPGVGASVLIKRVSFIDTPRVDFTDGSAHTATDHDLVTNQMLHSIQELNVRIDGIDAPPPGGGGTVPTPTAASRMLVSAANGGGFEWQTQTVAEVQTLLGIGGGGPSVPTPVAGNQFLITNTSSAAYELATIATVKSIIGLDTARLCPSTDPTRPGFVVGLSPAGTVYELTGPATLRAFMSLGTAALTNVGTSVGNVTQLVSHPNGPALPAVRADNLLGIAKEPDLAVVAVRNGERPGPPSTDPNVYFGLNTTYNDISVRKGANTGYFIRTAPLGSWLTVVAGTPNVIRLALGSYKVRIKGRVSVCGAGNPGAANSSPCWFFDSCRLRIASTSGTVVGLPVTGEQEPVKLITVLDTATGSGADASAEWGLGPSGARLTQAGEVELTAVLRVTSGSADIKIEGQALSRVSYGVDSSRGMLLGTFRDASPGNLGTPVTGYDALTACSIEIEKFA